jgi:steroid delta-isomerase-like uncharacterized protein
VSAESDLIQRWIDAQRERDIEALKSILASNPRFHDSYVSEPMVGFDAFAKAMQDLWISFPGLSSDIEEMITSENRAVVRWHDKFPHEGDYFGLEGDGRVVQLRGCTVFHIANGKITDVYTYADNLSFQRQLLGESYKMSVG